MHYLLLISLLLFSGNAACQQYMYVITDNLIVRDLPRDDYEVFCIVHAPARVEILPFDDEDAGKKTITDKFRFIRVRCLGKNDSSHSVYGYVEKRYLGAVQTVPGFDTTGCMFITRTPSDRYISGRSFGNDDRGIEYSNARKYLPPKYKGGNTLAATAKPAPRVYRPGPRGGCYYYNGVGKKIYVSPDHCKRK